jgi:non-haem Fe2+, alpha-ketoglutarate-dependent halogenase
MPAALQIAGCIGERCAGVNTEESAMPKLLSLTEIGRFRNEGYLSPVRIMSEDEAASIRARLEEFESRTGGPLRGDLRHKTHLLFPWLADLVRNPKILDAVEDLYGSDLLCWTSNFFIKEARNPAFVSWHQDSTYWGLSAPDVVTAWVALTPSNEANGAMQVMPGTHTMDQLPHRDTFDKHNLLTRGQEIEVQVDPSKAVILTLQPGEMSLHHVRLVHGSPANPSDDRRIGFAIRYIPTRVSQTAGEDSATLVRGEDHFHHFELEAQPDRELAPEFLALHKKIAERNARILYRGTNVSSYNDPAAIRG